ncbi:MAG: DUF3341 domain-containing protein [Phycisphaeraceae bacterium]|nr:DUF3341 domain-containing protein [Phycisphaeraceae bacterium]
MAGRVMAGRATGTIYTTESGVPVYGIVAEYATPADLYRASEMVRDAGYARWDAYSPFPVHGLDEAMGIRRTRLPILIAVIGLTGAALGYLMQHWMSAVDYAQVVQGKNPRDWEAYIPITFELGILSAAFTAILGMLAFNRLPMWNHPLLRKDRFLRVSDDRFMICIEASDDRFDPEKTRHLLEAAGGTNVDLVEDEPEMPVEDDGGH